MAASLPLVDSFDSGYSTGEINGQNNWAGTNGVFTVSTTNPDTSPNDVASVNSPPGNRGVFLPTNATFVFDQSFRMRVDTMPVDGDMYDVILHKQTADPNDPSTGRLARIGVTRVAGNYNATIVLSSGTLTIASSISTGSYHTFRFQVDSSMGTNGQIRGSIDGGAFTSWGELDASIVVTGVLSIGIWQSTDPGTNTVYFDTFTNPNAPATNSKFFMFMPN